MSAPDDALRVLFDGYWVGHGPPSGRNVVRSQISAWATAHPSDQVIVSRGPDGPSVPFPIANTTVGRTRALRPHGISNMFELGSSDDADVIFSQNFSPMTRPSSRVKAVFFHDAIARSHPEWFTRKERAYLAVAERSLRFADIVFTSSSSEARRITALIPNLRAEVVPIGLGLSISFAEATPTQPALAVKRHGFILTVGRLNIRKNLARLIRALRAAKLISTDFPLVVVGTEDGRVDPGMNSDKHPSDLIYTGFIPDSELKWLYSECASFVFPSLDEGFGLPILEAQSRLAPVAASDIPAFREFHGPVNYFDPRSETDMASAVERTIRGPRPDPSASSEQSGAGAWERSMVTARDVIKAYI